MNNLRINNEKEKRMLWRDIIKTAKDITDAGWGHIRIVKEYADAPGIQGGSNGVE